MEKNEKLLTVGVAAYNVEKEITDCLNSLLIPEVLDKLEILVINDGSKDHTRQVVEAYVQKYPKTVFLINKRNGGHGSAINKTIENAHGKYLKMVDADDSVDKSGFISLIDHLSKSNVDMIFSPYYRRNINTGKKQEIGYLSNSSQSYLDNVKDTLNTYASSLIVAMHSITYKTSLLKKSKYRMDEHCFYVDVEYTIYYLPYVKNILLLSEPVYNYNIGSEDQSVNINNMRKRRDQHLKVTKSLINFYESEKNTFSSEMKSMVENNVIKMILATEYKLLMSLPSGQVSKKELVAFDRYLKERSSDLYEGLQRITDSKKIKIILFFRKTNFVGYELVHRLLKNKLIYSV